MKKLIGLLALTLTFIACENDVKFNEPGFQAQRIAEQNDTVPMPTYEYWKANEFTAKVHNGNVIIIGSDDTTTLEFRTNTYEFGVKYDLGVLEANRAKVIHVDDEGKLVGPVFETNGSLGSGYISFDPVDRQVPGTISGTFNVTLVDKNNPKVKTTYNKGVFYRIPLEEAK